jgi:hypothetical protein
MLLWWHIILKLLSFDLVTIPFLILVNIQVEVFKSILILLMPVLILILLMHPIRIVWKLLLLLLLDFHRLKLFLLLKCRFIRKLSFSVWFNNGGRSLQILVVVEVGGAVVGLLVALV